jgi:hypothetical protein
MRRLEGATMSANDVTSKAMLNDDRLARKAAADSLRRQIDNLAGRTPQTLNEFAEKKAAEDRDDEATREGT